MCIAANFMNRSVVWTQNTCVKECNDPWTGPSLSKLENREMLQNANPLE